MKEWSRKIRSKSIVTIFLLILLATSIEIVWAAVDPWAPNNYNDPSRIYDDGTYVRYHQEFLWDQAHVNELHEVTGSDGKYQHEFRRNVDKWDSMDSLCNHYSWWSNLPSDGLHTASEEQAYPWCDIPAIQNDEEAEIVTYGPTDIQANTWYYVTFTFYKRSTTGTLELETQAEYADLWWWIPDDSCTLTETTENP
ncbi:MAG: hypothetical protein R6U44_09615 [Archaeoglobaceae archaeon]